MIRTDRTGGTMAALTRQAANFTSVTVTSRDAVTEGDHGRLGSVTR